MCDFHSCVIRADVAYAAAGARKLHWQKMAAKLISLLTPHALYEN